jgi:hypothetical protein
MACHILQYSTSRISNRHNIYCAIYWGLWRYRVKDFWYKRHYSYWGGGGFSWINILVWNSLWPGSEPQWRISVLFSRTDGSSTHGTIWVVRCISSLFVTLCCLTNVLHWAVINFIIIVVLGMGPNKDGERLFPHYPVSAFIQELGWLLLTGDSHINHTAELDLSRFFIGRIV